MKIGIVCYPTFGGSGVVATELGKALAAKGHEIHFITYSQPVRLDYFSKNLFYHEVTIESYPLFEYPPYELILTSKLVDVAKHEKLDLLHVHYAIPHASAAYMARQILKTHGIYLPFVTTLHGTDITLLGKDDSYEPVITFAINQSDVVTAVSESLKNDTLKFFHVNRDIRVVPNFICISDYQREPNYGLKKQLAPGSEKILMHVSNFRKVKRVEDTVRIFEKVKKVIPSKLVLIGDGPERHTVENMCRQLGTCDDVKFLGKVKSAESLLAAADLFLLPSETESFGLAALEAMASGVPVISSNTGGIPEVNRHGFSGYLSRVGDVEDMAKNAIAVLSNENVHREFRKNALMQAEKFDAVRILPMYEEIYDQAMYSKNNKSLH